MTWENIYQKKPLLPPPNKQNVFHTIGNMLDERKNEALSSLDKELGDYELYKNRLQSPHDYRRAIDYAYENSSTWKAEVILHLMPKDFFTEWYTKLLDGYIHNYFNSEGEQIYRSSVGKIAITELLLYYHPIRDVQMSGINLLLAKDIGDGSEYHDIGLTLCLQSNCYLEPEDQHAHYDDTRWRRVIDPYCIVHGNYIFSKEDRDAALSQWEDTVLKYI